MRRCTEVTINQQHVALRNYDCCMHVYLRNVPVLIIFIIEKPRALTSTIVKRSPNWADLASHGRRENRHVFAVSMAVSTIGAEQFLCRTGSPLLLIRPSAPSEPVGAANRPKGPQNRWVQSFPCVYGPYVKLNPILCIGLAKTYRPFFLVLLFTYCDKIDYRAHESEKYTHRYDLTHDWT